MIRVLNFGAGVQSSTLLYQSLAGELPKLDHVIFADTGDEPKPVYEWMEKCRRDVEAAGIPLHVVKSRKGALSEHVKEAQENRTRCDSPPFFAQNSDGRPGPISRKCTREWKIEPIRRKTKELLGLKPASRWPKTIRVETWLGISIDELQRMKVSTEPWQRFWHPLIEHEWQPGATRAQIRVPAMRRSDCLQWMTDHGHDEPPRSACWHCPFRSNNEWRWLQKNDPEGWAKACEFDRQIREHGLMHGMSGLVFLHRSLTPIADAVTDQALPSLWDNECGGICGV